MEPGEGAVNRVAYEAHVNNIVLPLMRSYFGAQFTEKEGESLKTLLGNPNLSPAERNAALDAFLANKKADIERMQRKAGTEAPAVPNPAALRQKYGLE